MGIAPEMKLVIKRTFLEFVEENAFDGSLRPRSFTDSAVRLSSSCEKDQEEPEIEASSDASGSTTAESNADLVNESATEELKAFLGLGRAEELLSSPPANLPGSPSRKSPALPPLREEQLSENQATWSQAMDPLTLPQCCMTAWWVPVTFDAKPVLQISDMISPPVVEEAQQETYMSQQWQTYANVGFESAYADGNVNVCSTEEEQRTTVILRNLPNNYTRGMLLDLLDSEGFARKYDFVYIPVDFSTQAGLGYAFVNLVSPSDALAFWAHFEGFRRWSLPSEKVCTLNWSSPIQGLAPHVERYRNSPVMHEAVPDEWKPAIYFHGERVVFPPPTKALKAPKIRSNKAAVGH